MAWHDRENEEMTVRCPGGIESPPHSWGPVTARNISLTLKGADLYSFGDHVSDPMAVVMRYLSFLQWRPLARAKMLCPECRGEMADG